VEGLDWITALRAPAIAALVEGGSLQLSLFDKKDLGADLAYNSELRPKCTAS
jgi:hypothetical protein